MADILPTMQKYADLNAVAQAAADHFIELAATAIAQRGRFSVALSGGSTPKALFRLLVTDAYLPRVDWNSVHLFWGDERCVPPDHPDSNYRMTQETLLSQVTLPAPDLHRILGEIEPQDAAAEYERLLHEFFSATPGQPAPSVHFDLVFLGMGHDGHTLSLFPGSEAVRKEVAHEQNRWAVANYAEKLNSWRVTLTTRPVNEAANVTFLVAGADKAQTLQQVLQGPHQPGQLPAQLIAPTNGRLIWMVDQAAAALL